MRVSIKVQKGVSAARRALSIIHRTAAARRVALTLAERASWEEVEPPGTCKEEEGANVLEGPEAKVGKDAFAGIEPMSTSRDVSTGAVLLLLVSSRVYSTSIRQMSVEEEGLTLISLASSHGTLARRHNSVIRTRNGMKVDAPSGYDILRQDTFGWHRMDSFWDGIMVLLMKPN
ncbi:hypothetical protein H5410_002774 [Solanum commersonii]|uniref:Uncharacterized protein n=1 Tax=Solanum commersonii TaxID=4109 RepID=A0A9J6B2X9_SOLCO|nr:hypothetical protein H5410_002774 [Solanum commersonii]